MEEIRNINQESHSPEDIPAPSESPPALGVLQHKPLQPDTEPTETPRRRSSFSFLSLIQSGTSASKPTGEENASKQSPFPFARKSSFQTAANNFMSDATKRGSLGLPLLSVARAVSVMRTGQTVPLKGSDEPAEPKTHNGWSGPKYGSSEVTVRTKGRRAVYLYKAADVALFDRIAKWKTPQNTLEDAWDMFGSGALLYGQSASSPDAFIKLHFGVLRYDYILKCVSVPGDSKGDSLRRRFETKLLQKGLIIEREASLETPNEIFIKVITPFSALCAEAQLMKLKLPLKDDTVSL
ncbi:UNVERIFIED_CONTAM: hypothetical protein HDU68_011746 [Siphonaria sp. JEL0065]|nr:hypothetical protein HDU68_011746 [Siphonaria sp. JEL0065]